MARGPTFAVLFRSIVGPRLREYCRALGADVAWGIRDFGSAHALGMRYALRFGAAHLPQKLYDDLGETIGTWILEGAGAVANRLEGVAP